MLPDNPPGNSRVEYVPLGGNGIVAPHSYWAFDLELAADASSGELVIRIRLDQRYTCIPAYVMALGLEVPAGGQQVELIAAASPVDRVSCRHLVNKSDLSGYDNYTWEPTPLIMRGKPAAAQAEPWIRLKTTNTDGQTWKLVGRVYNFDVNAEQYVDLGKLYEVLPR